MSKHVKTIIIPGWRNSGPGHWQTIWSETLPNTVRVVQDDWISPVKDQWVKSISDLILEQEEPVVVVAHSLGCIATMHLPRLTQDRIVAALLVAPANPQRRSVFVDFTPVPSNKLTYPSIVVSSDSDPYCDARSAGAFARSWGSDYVRLKDAGHINIESGHGDWPFGLTLLQSLISRVNASVKVA